MATYARELLGDLIVATTELVEAGAPPGERWLWLAIATGLAVGADDDVAPLAALVWDTPFGAALHDRARRVTAWPARCLHRSALELLRELSPERDIDTSDLELAMIAADPTSFVAVAPPEGVPAHHWWWRSDHPPGELRLNPRMADLLALRARQVPPAFRRLIADGLPAETMIAVEAYLPPDDSRRPVDLAATVLACARWLAAELRRRSAVRYRIVATVRRETMTSRLWFGSAPAIELETDDGVLVLDTQ